MRTAGIVCEYNPFHKGHKKQMQIIRNRLGEDTAVICLMSGNFVQRGFPAIYDKTVRARAAVLAGADLVLELPVTCVLQSAEGFASGAVRILDAVGTDFLCFGCECGETDAVMKTAGVTLDAGYQELLHEGVSQGMSYAAAGTRALKMTDDRLLIPEKPNDILAVEYCRELIRLNSGLKPLAVKRCGDYHALEADRDNPSAAACRSAMETGGDWESMVPEEAAELYRSANLHRMQSGERAVLARLRTLTEEEWKTCAHGSEGLWSKMRNAVREYGSTDEIIEKTVSKRYPRTRIQRLMTCAYLGIPDSLLRQQPPYVRILAFSETGRTILRSVRDSGRLNLVNAGEEPCNEAYYSMEMRCSDLYEMFAEEGSVPEASAEKYYRIFRKP